MRTLTAVLVVALGLATGSPAAATRADDDTIRTKVSLTASTTARTVVFKVIRREQVHPSGYAVADGFVALQLKGPGGWAAIPGSRTYATNGHAALRYVRPDRVVTVRAVTSDGPLFVNSFSRPVTIKPPR